MDSEALAAKTRDVMHELALGAAHLAIDRGETARTHLEKASRELALLRVQLDQAIGPKTLPRKRRR